MPIKNVKRPPEIPAPGYRFKPEFVLGQLRVHPVHLRDADGVSDLRERVS